MDRFSPDQKVAAPSTPSASAATSTTDASPSSGTVRKPKRLLLKDKDAIQKIRGWWKAVNEDWKELVEAVGFLPGSDLEKTAYFMMMGFMTQDTRHIQMVMPGCSRKWLQFRRERARKYGIWCGNGQLHADWFDYAEKQDGTAEVAFMCDVMVINGDMEKIWNPYRREYAYRLSKAGIEWAQRLSSEPKPLPRATRRELDRYTDDGNRNGD